jgi:metal-dependent hydrolase (beta-lactamase superfamily II)
MHRLFRGYIEKITLVDIQVAMVAGTFHLIKERHNCQPVIASQRKSFEVGIEIIDIHLDGLKGARILDRSCQDR